MWSDWNMGNVNIEIWDNEVFFRAPFCGRMVPLWGLATPPTGLQTSQLLQAVLQLPTRLNNLPQIGSRPPCLEKFSWFFSGLCEDEDWRDLGWCWLQQEHCHRWIRLCLREASNLLVVCSSIVTFPPNLTHFEDQIRIVDEFIEFIKFHTFPLNIFKLFSDVFPQTLSDFTVVGVLKDWNWVRICRWSITGDQMCQQPGLKLQIFHRILWIFCVENLGEQICWWYMLGEEIENCLFSSDTEGPL